MRCRMNGLRNKLQRQKKGSLELRREKGKGNVPGGKRRGEGKMLACILAGNGLVRSGEERERPRTALGV